MKTECYLIVTGKPSRYRPRDYIDPGPIRVTKRKPSTAANEVAIKVILDLPDALFRKPTMEVRLSAADPAPLELDPDVQDQIAQIIADQTGMSATVRFEAPEQSDG